MSYIRFGEEGSDVYVYKTVYEKGSYACVHPDGRAFMTRVVTDMIKHLEEHKLEGDKVPESCFEKLLKDTES